MLWVPNPFRRAPVYLLCSGAYVPSDFHIVRAYPGKMYCWGYFPETRHYDIDRLLEEKGYGEEKIPSLLWAARGIKYWIFIWISSGTAI